MAKKMQNLPGGLIPDSESEAKDYINHAKDNVVYYDTEKEQFYIIKWEDGGNSDIPIRHYIPKA